MYCSRDAVTLLWVCGALYLSHSICHKRLEFLALVMYPVPDIFEICPKEYSVDSKHFRRRRLTNVRAFEPRAFHLRAANLSFASRKPLICEPLFIPLQARLISTFEIRIIFIYSEHVLQAVSLFNKNECVLN
jgi:hypothetical protein